MSFAPAPIAAFAPGRGRPRTTARPAHLRLARTEWPAAAAPDRLRSRAHPASRRPHDRALSRCLSSPAARTLLPRLGQCATDGQSRSARRGSLRGFHRLADRGRQSADAESRRDRRLRQAVLLRRTGAQRAQCRRAAVAAGRLLPPAGKDRAVRRPLDAPAGGRSHAAGQRHGAARSWASARCSAAGCGTGSTSFACASGR